MTADARLPAPDGTGPQLAGLPLYLLIDPLFGEPPWLGIDAESAHTFDELAGLRSRGWQGRRVVLAQGAEPIIEAHRLPYLVALEGAQDLLFGRIAQAALAEQQEAVATGSGMTHISGLLETSLDATRLMERLQHMWQVAPRGHSRYLRISDARVFETLCHLFEPHELAPWLGPLAHWHYLARSGHWQRCDGAAAESLITDEAGLCRRTQCLEELASIRPSLHWAPERVMRLDDSRALSLALTRLQQGGVPVTAEHFVRGWDALAQARRAGLRHLEDQVAFAWRSLLPGGARPSSPPPSLTADLIPGDAA
ncbi:MAG TPA: DUF4123 domain-containing protein [Ideonella sp.]|nr:DUF4123 domain-containing protein [Ideonella sp.]